MELRVRLPRGLLKTDRWCVACKAAEPSVIGIRASMSVLDDGFEVTVSAPLASRIRTLVLIIPKPLMP